MELLEDRLNLVREDRFNYKITARMPAFWVYPWSALCSEIDSLSGSARTSLA
jgi:hypothetical protein